MLREGCAALVVSAALSGLCGEMLANPGFDGEMTNGIAAGWLMPGKKCTVGNGYGQNGGNGLRYVGDGGSREWVYQRLPVQPGERYVFSAWVKTKDICGKTGASLYVTFADAEKKWLEGTNSSSVNGTTEDWVPLEVEVVAHPRAATAEVCIGIGDGETGTAYYDDFSFVKRQRPPIRFLASSAYRDTASNETVGFRLVSNLADHEIADRGLKGSAWVPDARNPDGRRALAVPGPTNGVWAFSLDLTGLPYGEMPVAFAIDGTNGDRVATATLLMNHVRERPNRRVWIDERGRAIVDGKPFFPLGMFTVNLRGEQAEEYARGPFNCVLPYWTMTRDDLDWAAARGLKVICSLKDHYRGFSKQPCLMADDEDETSVVASLVANLKDHPALLAWYLCDEMGPGMIPRLTERNRLFRRVDPDHPTVHCLCRADIARDYMETADVLCGDSYPIKGGEAVQKIARVAENTRTFRTAYFRMRPQWQVPQAFDWSYFHKEPDNVRIPTQEEILNMNLQCVAEGANGIVMYAYHHLGHTGRGDRNRDLRWREVCAVGETIRAMIPVFLADDISERVTGCKDDLPVRAWRHEGKTWVLAVNASYERKQDAIAVDGRSLELDLPVLGYFFGALQDDE